MNVISWKRTRLSARRYSQAQPTVLFRWLLLLHLIIMSAGTAGDIQEGLREKKHRLRAGSLCWLTSMMRYGVKGPTSQPLTIQRRSRLSRRVTEGPCRDTSIQRSLRHSKKPHPCLKKFSSGTNREVGRNRAQGIELKAPTGYLKTLSNI